MKLSMPSWPLSRGSGSGPDSTLSRLEVLDAQLAELRRAELERISSLTAEEAQRMLLEEVEADARRQAGLALRKIEEETRREAERRARGILATAAQRLAGPYAERTTTQLVQLPLSLI